MRSDLDEKFMQYALMLADRAEALGEIPVGAVLVDDEGNILGEGWNLSIISLLREKAPEATTTALQRISTSPPSS